jgi:hypothetical protein
VWTVDSIGRYVADFDGALVEQWVCVSDVRVCSSFDVVE